MANRNLSELELELLATREREREAERLLGLSFEAGAGASGGNGSANEDDRSLDEGEEVPPEEKKQVSVSHLISGQDGQGGESDLNRSNGTTDRMLTLSNSVLLQRIRVCLYRRYGNHTLRQDTTKSKVYN